MSTAVPIPPAFFSRAKRPWVTLVILGINCAVFAAQAANGMEGEAWVFKNLAQDRLKVWEGEYWRLITPIFVQTMLFHLAFNMFAHVYLGRVMERIFGWGRFLLLYLVAGLSGSVAFQLVSEGGPGVGASGAIYGVAGAFLLAAYGRNAQGDIAPGWRFFRVLLFIVAVDQVFAYLVEKANPAVRIAASAHFGGLIGGLALGYVLTPRPRGVREATFRRRVAAACGFAVALTATGIYGCFYTIHDKEWRRLTSVRDLERHVRERRFEAAVEAWRSLPVDSDAIQRATGYRLFEDLMGVGKDDLGAAVLNDLIHSAESSLEDIARRGDPPAELLNEVAWYHALDGTDLQAALKLSEEAVRKARAAAGGWLFRWLPRNRDAGIAEGVYINTRGWIRLQLQDSAGALEDLKAACALVPAGVNYAYLALAHDRLGNRKEAHEAANKAAELDDLSPYEKRLLSALRN